MLKRRLIICIICILTAVSSINAKQADKMSITVKKAQIRTSPSFLGKIVIVLSYADRVEVFDERAGWFFVGTSKSSKRGWIHSSAVTNKKIVLKAGDKDLTAGASSNEVALAGKGFNSQVEAEYKSQKNLDYTWVDKMETYDHNVEEVIKFLNDGGVYPKEVN